MHIEREQRNDGKANTTPVSFRVVKRIATAEEIDPKDVPSLAQRIDFEALDRLIAESSTDLMVFFSIDGYDVEITSDGTVLLS